MTYKMFINKEAGGQSTITGFFSKKDSSTVAAPINWRPTRSVIATVPIPSQAVLPQAAVHTCAGVFATYRTRATQQLLRCWENYGLPGDTYKLGIAERMLPKYLQMIARGPTTQKNNLMESFVATPVKKSGAFKERVSIK
jgi:hypothetical protein